MKIKRYVVREMQEAIQLIKQDLGPEALIVSSYKVLAKGFLGFFSPRLLEVTAVLDDKPEIKLKMNMPPAQLAGEALYVPERQTEPPKSQAGTFPAGKQTNHYPGMLNMDIGERKESMAGPSYMQSRQVVVPASFSGERLSNHTRWRPEENSCLFDKMVSKHVNPSLLNDPAKLRKMLLDMDVQDSIADYLLSFMWNGQQSPDFNDQDLYTNIFKQIVHLLNPAYRSGEYARVLTFVGPSGVGKTTTLAKLATKFSLYDHKKIALVTILNYRIGAAEQLQAYGDFLGIPVEVVMTPAELNKVLESHRDKDYIFIDTVGRSAQNAGQLLELKGFLGAVEEQQDIHLVLSLATKSRDLSKIASEFRKIGYSKLIFTKVDETETHGAMLNLISEQGLPAAYLTGGQVVPDDISEANPKKIAKLLLRGVDPYEIMAT